MSVKTAATLTVAALAWGALTFGAVYPWGYWPLLAASVLIGAGELVVARREGPPLRNVATALGIVAVVGAAQLIPLSAPTIASGNPARDAFLKRYDVLYATTTSSHALSINPETTAIALVCFAAFSVLALGTARLASDRGALRILTNGIMAFGALLALIAMAQDVALVNRTGEGHTVLIYGFWPDPYVNKPFGPYINKNNYAGWMLMAVPLTLGLFAAGLERLWRSVGSDWTARFLALSSREGAKTLLAGLAALVMSVSVVASMSRSGMIALAATLFGLAWFAPLEKPKAVVRVALASVALIILAAWVGPDTIRNRFEDRSEASMRGRFIAWQNALRISANYPIIGIGFNTFATAMLLEQQGDPVNFWEEAHNDYLQIAAEGGIIGSAAGLLAIVVIASEIRRRFRDVSPSRTSLWLRVGAVAGICAIGLQEFVEFSLQIAGNAALFAILIGIALHKAPSGLQGSRRRAEA